MCLLFNKRNQKENTNVPMEEKDLAEFARKCARANMPELCNIASQYKAVVQLLTEEDKAFCAERIINRCEQLMEHFKKYGCYPE